MVRGRKNLGVVPVRQKKVCQDATGEHRAKGDRWGVSVGVVRDRLSRTYMVKIGLSLNRQMLQLTINCCFCLI